MIEENILNETNPLIDLTEQVRAVEALLFASSDPLDEKSMLDKASETRFGMQGSDFLAIFIFWMVAHPKMNESGNGVY